MEISPGNVSDRKRPLPKILKIKNSHDAKQLLEAVLCKSFTVYRILSVKIAENATESQIGAGDFGPRDSDV